MLTPSARGYDADDVAIIEAISRFRAGGYEEAIGFTVYDTLRYREALAPLVEDEVRVLLHRLAGKVEVDRAVEIIASGAEPLRELIGAMHSKLLLAALRRQRARATPDRLPPRRGASITPYPSASSIRPGAAEKCRTAAVAAADEQQIVLRAPHGLGVERSPSTAREIRSGEVDRPRLVRLAVDPDGPLAVRRRVIDPATRFQASARPSRATRLRRTSASGCGARSSRRCRRSPPAVDRHAAARRRSRPCRAPGSRPACASRP